MLHFLFWTKVHTDYGVTTIILTFDHLAFAIDKLFSATERWAISGLIEGTDGLNSFV